MNRVQGLSRGSRWPIWVWPIAIALASTQPLIHVWLVYFPPEGTVSSGLDILDSAVMLSSMRMFQTDFYSPYATCLSPYSMNNPGYFPIPFQWVYGAFGLAVDACGLDRFLCYGLINGIGMLLFLCAAYALFREVIPRCADRAFLLFALSGGVGGVAYLLTAALGVQQHPSFDAYFFRYAMYELIEGANILPICCQPRFYYTAALGLCLAALTMLIRYVRSDSRGALAWAVALFLMGAGINLRFGVFTWGVATLYLYLAGHAPVRARLVAAAAFSVPIVAAGLVTRWTMGMNPVIVQNAVSWSNVASWFSALVTALGLHVFLAPWQAAVGLRGLPRFPRALAWAGIGYLAAYIPLYAAYQVYFGNILAGRDFAVAVAVSDWALIGAALGACLSLRQCTPSIGPDERAWVSLWLIGFAAVTISAFGHGWFLRFGPQRLQPLLWIPVCMCTAMTLEHLSETRKTLARVLTGVLVVCGACSTLVAVLCFQGPLQYNRDGFPYSDLHAELMTVADARLIDKLGEGRVMTLPSTADAIVQKRGNPVVCGVGSFNMTDQPYLAMRGVVDRFFAKDTPDSEREAIAKKWCADYVLCPDTTPVNSAALVQLREASWLREIAAEGRGVLFEMKRK